MWKWWICFVNGAHLPLWPITCTFRALTTFLPLIVTLVPFPLRWKLKIQNCGGKWDEKYQSENHPAKKNDQFHNVLCHVLFPNFLIWVIVESCLPILDVCQICWTFYRISSFFQRNMDITKMTHLLVLSLYILFRESRKLFQICIAKFGKGVDNFLRLGSVICA